MLHATEPSPAGPARRRARFHHGHHGPRNIFSGMRAHRIVRAHISSSPQASFGRAGTVPWTRVSAREPQELREEELREALGTMTGQENERGKVFDELRDRRVGKC